MSEAFFVVMWLIPVIAFVLIAQRAIKTVRMVQKHVKDPEAFAAAVRKAVESSQQGGEFDTDSVVAKLLAGERDDATGASFTSGNQLPPSRPAPFGESESSSGSVWLAIVVALAIAAVAIQLQ